MTFFDNSRNSKQMKGAFSPLQNRKFHISISLVLTINTITAKDILPQYQKRRQNIKVDIFINIRLCFMQAYVTIAQSCGDASSQFSHVLTEIIFVEIVFLATGSGYSDCWPYVGIICFKAFSVWDLSFFCSIEIFFDLDI